MRKGEKDETLRRMAAAMYLAFRIRNNSSTRGIDFDNIEPFDDLLLSAQASWIEKADFALDALLEKWDLTPKATK